MDFWRLQVQRFRSSVKKAAPFASGVLAALLALLLYGALFPAAKPLTTRDVNNTIAQAMASATPEPSFSSQVYKIIQPSLVLIETKDSHPNSVDDFGLGTGVVIDMSGDILTSLHVVKGATEIHVTFADGSKSDARVANSQPE
ncbi:MAG TPA: hypothetical protein VF338_06545, partial [Leptolinea sp.]